MGTKVAISFANICMAEVETDVINQSPNIPLIWKRYLWNTNKEAINNFTELANRFHPSIRFTAEISHTEITFMETCLYKGDRLKKNSSLDQCRIYSVGEGELLHENIFPSINCQEIINTL